MTEKKFINKREDVVRELLEGYALAYPDKVQLAGNSLVVRAQPKASGKVGIVTLGGSGHEPGLSGFVGTGMLDVSVPGEIFAAPGPPRCLEAIKTADRGAGVLFVVLNHAGDMLSANVTMDLLKKENVKVKKLVTQEDISSGPREKPEERRGLVGFLPVYKIAGAAAEQGMSLEQVHDAADRFAKNMRTLAVAVKTATHPSTGDAIFTLPDDEMEVGMGQHGEAGTGRMKMKTADETAEIMLAQLLADLEAKAGDELLVILNGAGATTLMELFIVFRRVSQILKDKKIKIARSLVGEYITTQEQAGFQMFIARMDPELIRLWDAPCDTPYFVMR
ncbi:MAG: dihydroxyacetone kinase subunit DhaK [Kiritimatiellae bacterium]|nr:dihydroxyacetone kinase subunit DhaK [Kiritimatiellia bacterium]